MIKLIKLAFLAIFRNVVFGLLLLRFLLIAHEILEVLCYFLEKRHGWVSLSVAFAVLRCWLRGEKIRMLYV